MPIYKYGDFVRFLCNGEILEGTIRIVDSYGTMEQNEEPSYDIEVGGEENILYKHIPESQIIRKDFKREECYEYR